MILREPLNGFIHFIGILLSILATIVLVAKGTGSPVPWRTASFIVYGIGMVLLYSASTMYHWLPLHPRGTKVLRRVDHAMIFVYIAACYTPICIVALRGAWGWAMGCSVWGLAVAGLFLAVFWIDAPRALTTGLYLAMGWTAVIALWPLWHSMPRGGVLWLVAGGLVYSMGAVIYALKRPSFGVLGFHELFHLFVIGGSACHFWVMFRYIAEMRPGC